MIDISYISIEPLGRLSIRHLTYTMSCSHWTFKDQNAEEKEKRLQNLWMPYAENMNCFEKTYIIVLLRTDGIIQLTDLTRDEQYFHLFWICQKIIHKARYLSYRPLIWYYLKEFYSHVCTWKVCHGIIFHAHTIYH